MADEKISLSKHAVRRLGQRNISLDRVRRTLLHSDRVEVDRDDPQLRHAIKRFHTKSDSVVLRVVYNPAVMPWRVVTAFYDRKLRRKR